MRYPWPQCCQVDALQKRFNDLGKGSGFVVPSPAKLRVVFFVLGDQSFGWKRLK